MALLSLALAMVCMQQTSPARLQTDSTDRLPPSQSIRLQLGTTGPGLFYKRVLSAERRLSLRAGGQYVAYRKLVRIETDPGSYLNIRPDFVIGLVRADLTWHPFRRKSLFVAAGLGYTWHPNLDFVVNTDSKLSLGGLELTAEDVGTIKLGLRWQSVVGYAGWGFERLVARKRIGVGFEMGVLYLGPPRVQLAYEGFLETTNLDEQVPIVAHNLRNYRYLPSLNFILSYSLTRRP